MSDENIRIYIKDRSDWLKYFNQNPRSAIQFKYICNSIASVRGISEGLAAQNSIRKGSREELISGI